jgi:hypothetical protein
LDFDTKNGAQVSTVVAMINDLQNAIGNGER